MFIREKIKSRNGKKYIQHQLIESVRTPAGPRQVVVLNLGIVKLSRDKWKDLANRIESKLFNQSRLFAYDREVEKLAQHYVQLIVKKRLSEKDEKILETPEENKQEFESIDINSATMSDARTIGSEYVALSQMSEYCFDNILKSQGFDSKQINYAKMLIVGRMTHPASERETTRWLKESSGLMELLDTDINVYDNALHRTAALLWERHEEIEEQLSNKAKALLSLDENIILYDLTNTYFAGSKKGSKIAKPGGKSKEKRNDRPLVTLALTVDEEGFPKYSKVLEGNISEPQTLEDMLTQLNDRTTPLFTSFKTIVIDAGIATEDNLKLISTRGFKYVAVSRKESYDDCFWDTGSEKEIKLADGKTRLKIKLVRTEEEGYLLCHSEAKEAKEMAIFERRTKKFEEELQKIKEGLGKKGTQKSYEKILERIGRLKEKYKVGSLYDIVVDQKEGLVFEISFAKNPNGKAKESRYGEYVLRTNRLDLTDEEISKVHRSLTTVEASFRSMKSELGIRPNYHKRDEMTIAHIFITVIGYHFLAGILKKLKAKGITYCWDTVRKILLSHIRVSSTFSRENGDTVIIRNSTTPTPNQQEIYNCLKIKQNPLKRINTIIPLNKNIEASK